MEIVRARYDERQKRHKRRAKVVVSVFLALLIIGSGSGYAFAAMQKDLPPLQYRTNEITPPTPEAIALAWPAYGQSAIGSMQDGVLATSSEAPKQLPMASMAKAVTALAVMKKQPFTAGEPGRTNVVDATDVSYYNSYLAKLGTVLPVRTGQTMTQEHALQALLIASSNNIADSLVRWTFGSTEVYVAYANDMLAEYGLKQTRVADASGFAPQSVSVPAEMIVLGQKLLQNDVLKGIVDMPQATIPQSGTIRNTNRLVEQNGIIGIKTGTTDEAGNCLLFASTHAIDAGHQTTIIGVIMGAPASSVLFSDVQRLLAEAKTGFGQIEVLAAGTTVGSVKSQWGGQADVKSSGHVYAYGWKGKAYPLDMKISNDVSTLEPGQVVGQVRVENEEPVALTASEAVAAPGPFWKLTNYF